MIPYELKLKIVNVTLFVCKEDTLCMINKLKMFTP